MKRLYLAYGSNLNMEQMIWRCPDAVPVGTTMLENYELLFKGSLSGAYLTVEKRVGSRVPCGVWLISKRDEESLDRYEGCPKFYYKTEKSIVYKTFTGQTGKGKAIIYIMHEDRRLGIPDQHYVDVCTIGYQRFGFNDRYLEDALEASGVEVVGRTHIKEQPVDWSQFRAI